MNIGKNIKKYRKEKGLTQSELAEETHLALSTIQRYEKGHRQPTMEVLKKIATTLEVSISDLTGEDTYDKKVSRNIYTNMDDEELIDLFNLNRENFKTLSIDDKKDFIEKLSNIEPYKIKLQRLLDNIDNLGKVDLVNFCNDMKEYYINIFKTFISDDYSPLYNKYQTLLDFVKVQDEQIKSYQKVCDDMLNTLKNTNSNDNK